MNPHDEKAVAIIADLLTAREWPEPAESDEQFAEIILDALSEAGVLKIRRGPQYWSDALGRWVTVP